MGHGPSLVRVATLTRSLIPNFSYLSEVGASFLDDRLGLGLVPKTRLVGFSSPSFHYLYKDRHRWEQGWQPLPIIENDKAMTVLRDVAWQNATHLYVIGAQAAGQRLDVKALDVDAAAITSMGPLFDAAPLRLTSSQGNERLLILTEQGKTLRHEDQYRWVPVADKLSTVTYSS